MSFENNYLENEKLLKNICKKMCWNTHMISWEDVFQESSRKAFQNYQSFDGRNFIGWMTTIMKNTFLSEIERCDNSRINKRVVDVECYETECLADSPEKIIIQNDILKRILKMVQKDRREALVLFSMGYKAREIAELTGVETKTVLTRLHRGRKEAQLLLEHV